MASRFTLFKGSNSQYYFHLKAGNGEKILHSEGYISKNSCENGITSVKQNAPYDSRYEKRTSANSNYYFVLKSSNGQIVANSELYTNSSGRDNGIEVVKREAPGAQIEDIS